MMFISVIIPSYRRTQDLARCLKALQKQTRPADEVLVVVRDTDTETWLFLQTYNKLKTLRIVIVTVAGVVAAMNAGKEAAKGDIIASTDDDAAPHPDWLERIEEKFISDPQIGGVGGRDWQYAGEQIKEIGSKETVGRVQWFGRVIGNHHFGVGAAREVDVLKGVNMSFRTAAIAGLRFDERMRGTGAQVHFELAFTLAVKRAGWKIVFDPQVAVDHYPGVRFDEDKRDQFNNIALSNAVHNETLILLEHFTAIQRLIFLVWSILVGTREAVGLVQVLRLFPKEGMRVWQRWGASMRGRWQGWQTYFNKGRRKKEEGRSLQNALVNGSRRP